MMEVRRAGPEDAPELVRLRGVMLTGVAGSQPEPGPWQIEAERSLRRRLARPPTTASLAAYVVPRPGDPTRLAACAVGVIEDRLGDPKHPDGRFGYVFNVATDLPYRRRGYSRACLSALLNWYGQRGVQRVDLKATPAGEPLYRSFGFVPALRHTPMRLG